MGALLFFGVIAAALVFHYHQKSAGGAAASSRGDGAATLRQTGKCFRAIVGESHYQPALRRITGGAAYPDLGLRRMADLVCESGNRFDENAVQVKIGGEVVGYLPRTEAKKYRTRLAKAGLGVSTQTVAAAICGGVNGPNYGVWIDLPDKIV